MIMSSGGLQSYRQDKFCFNRPEYKDRLAVSGPKGWGMLKEKYKKDLGKRTYLNEIETEHYRVRVVQDHSGVYSMRDAENKPIHVNKAKFVIYDDNSNGHPQEKMVLMNTKTHHSVLAAGHDIKYGGLITTNEKGRVDLFSDITVDTGHYGQPCKMEAQNLAEEAQAKQFEFYIYTKFENLVDEAVSLDETSTTGLGLEAPDERLKEFEAEHTLTETTLGPFSQDMRWVLLRPKISVIEIS